MRHHLSLPPSRAEMPIKSEPVLARMLGLKRPTVRKAIDRLVEEGILIRRNGSGTYVRKVASTGDASAVHATSMMDGESLFDVVKERQQRCAPLNKDKKFEIGTVINWTGQSLSGVYKRIYDGLIARGEEIGAHINIHPLAVLSRSQATKERVRELLAEDQFDGLIVSSKDEVVLDVLSEQTHRPVVYLDFANRDWNLRLDLHPMISFDLRYAMISALKRFFAVGHQRIALVGFSYGGKNGTVDEEEDQLLYEYAMKRLGLQYRQAVFIGTDEEKKRACLEQMMTGPNAPTAVYFCDDVALIHAYPVLRDLGCKPGKDVAVITHSNKGVALPAGVDWSRMEFAPLQVATLTLDVIVAEMKSTLPDIVSLAHKPTWIAGTSHVLKKPFPQE